MNMLVCGTVLLALVGAVAANRLPNHLDGVPLDPSWLSGASRLLAVGNSISNDETICSTQYSCIDCQTARLCKRELNGSFTELMRVKCSPELPYCDGISGSCSAQMTYECGQTDSAFICSKDGYFPDPSNSSFYHICKNMIPHKFECSVPGQSYYGPTRTCTNFGGNENFQCLQSGVKTPYTLDNAYFGFCSKANAPPAIVDKCPRFTRLNSTSQLCETICISVENVPDSYDCSRYYRCDSVWIGSENVVVKVHATCPSNTSYNYVEKMCVERNDHCATDLP